MHSTLRFVDSSDSGVLAARDNKEFPRTGQRVLRLGTLALALCALLFVAPRPAEAQNVTLARVISTAAGNGTAGYSGDGGAATSAELHAPWGVATGRSGNIYIADPQNYRVRVVNVQSSSITIAGVTIPAGEIATVAGTGTAGYSGDGGPATSAELYTPWSVIVDSAGDVYIGDESNDRVREVNSSGIINTVAGNGTLGYTGDGGPATSAEFGYPTGIALDGAGNLYVGDLNNDVVRKVTPGGQAPVNFGQVTVSQTGTAQPVILSINTNLTINSSQVNGDFALTNASACNGAMTAGTFCTLQAQFSPTKPGQRWFQLTVTDSNANQYVFGLEGTGVGSALSFTPGIISTLAGNGTFGYSGDGGPATSAELDYPYGVAVDTAGNLYIGDTGNDRIRQGGHQRNHHDRCGKRHRGL